jgi:hypothetical protein
MCLEGGYAKSANSAGGSLGSTRARKAPVATTWMYVFGAIRPARRTTLAMLVLRYTSGGHEATDPVRPTSLVSNAMRDLCVSLAHSRLSQGVARTRRATCTCDRTLQIPIASDCRRGFVLGRFPYAGPGPNERPAMAGVREPSPKPTFAPDFCTR